MVLSEWKWREQTKKREPRSPALWLENVTRAGRHSRKWKLERAEFAGEQVQREIAINGLAAEPAGELMQHESGRDVGSVDRRARGTAAWFGFGLVEQRRSVMVAVRRVCHGQDSHDLAQHSAVGPEVARRGHRFPDRRARGDRIDAAEDRFADLLLRPKAVLDRLDLDGGINLSDIVSGCGDFRLANVGRSIALGRDVGGFDVIEVHQLQATDADSRELQSDLATDCSDADHGHEQFLQSVLWHEVRLSLEAVRGVRHGPPPRMARTG